MLTPETLPELQRALTDARLDGWLIYDFQGANPIAGGMLGLEGMVTRRIFALVPRTGVPIALTHAIEQGPWRNWPKDWKRERYSSWKSLEDGVARLAKGKRLAMEYSPGDAVPYVDRVPAGVLEMVKATGADIVSSGELISRFYALWTAEGIASHVRAAEVIAAIAREGIAMAGERARSATPMLEHELDHWILERFARASLQADHGPIVAAGENAANPHYSASPDRPRPIRTGELLLVDLFAHEHGGIYADQTWMGAIGEPSARAVEVWTAVRDGRDAAIAMLRSRAGGPKPLSGGELDDAARKVIRERKLDEYFTHRTGHSIDPRSLHGAGPHIDNLETREERLLIPGVGFSIEPGVYITGEIGVRSEVNAYMTEQGAEITPREYQRDLIVV